MKPVHFIDKLEHKTIVDAIARAESRTSGEIRVYISHRTIADAVKAAQIRFDKLGLRKHKHRNCVLIYLAPKSRVFAVIGDTAVHEKCGDGFWREVTTTMEEHLGKDSPTTAVVHAVEKVGELLAAHFPPHGHHKMRDDFVTEE